MSDLPTGTVTFLFTDIEGSTRLLEAAEEAYRDGLARHDAIVREAVAGHGGVIVQTRGDGFCAAFAGPTQALQTALAAQLRLLREPWGEASPIRVRMALHTGEVELRGDDYFGAPLHRCARLLDAAHGGQVVLSAATATLVGEALTGEAGLKDLGEHRLRDLARPERIYQLIAPDLPAEFPPLRTLTGMPSNLPPQATAFIGRERQIETVRGALLKPDVRLIMLTGPGGTGKTRLALQVAAGLLDSFADGVYFVALESVSDPNLVPSVIAQALDVREAVGRPITTSLAEALHQKQVLLVLDNFEQVVSAAPVLAQVLGAAPRIRMLVTSRAALRLYGERELAVPPLALPDHRIAPTADHLSRFEAVRLFVDRAQAVRADFVLTDENAAIVAEICQRLDGLPLAIELAAARVRSLPPRTMLQRMERRLPLLTGGARELPARQRTLRDAIAWSYDLLEPGEQTLFRRLAVFRGCALETAERVCAGEPSTPGATSVALAPLEMGVLDGLDSLVEKSLLRQEETPDSEPWYRMLETVREYALERLEESREAGAAHRRHALAALRLAETAEAKLYGPEHGVWFRRLEHEHDNVRAALDWCVGQRYAEPALRLAVALWWFWSAHGHIREARERMLGLLARFPMGVANPRAELRARALHGAGMLASIQGDHTEARAHQEEALRIRRALHDDVGIFNSLEALGTVACIQGDYAAALAYLGDARVIARQMDDSMSYASVMNALGNVHYEIGDLPAARAHFDESLDAYSRTRDPQYHTFNGAMLSKIVVAQDEGSYDEAHALLAETLAGCRQVSNRRFEALCLAILGGLNLAQGDHEAAHHHLAESIGMYQELGHLAGISQVLERFVALAAARSQHDVAIRLAAASTALHEQAGAPLMPNSRSRLERAIEPARRGLSGEAADANWQAGRALSLDQAIELALNIDASPAARVRPETSTTSLAVAASRGRGAGSVLTGREREVAGLIAQGLTNRQIAEQLVITEGTAANHVVHILNKLGYGSRAQVAVWAVEHELTPKASPK